MSPPKDRIRIAALGDLHYARTSAASMQPIFAQLAAASDILLLCGDLTDYGAAEEARALAARPHRRGQSADRHGSR